MGTSAGWGNPRVSARSPRLPARQTSPAQPSRPSTRRLPLQQSEIPGQLAILVVELLEVLRVRLAVQIAHVGALLLHGLGEGGLLARLGAGRVQLGDHVPGSARSEEHTSELQSQ